MLNNIRENIVYKVTFPNNKVYVGITSYNLSHRKREHFYKVKRGSKLYFHNALRKYTKGVTWAILEKTDTFELAKLKEKEYIRFFDAYKNGYNLTTGGDGVVGNKLTTEQKRRLSEAHKGYIMPQSQKDNISNANRGIVHKDARQLIGIHVKTGQVVKFDSITQAGKAGFTRSNISQCCLGKRKTHKSYNWKYQGTEE